MSVPERDLDKKAEPSIPDWLARKVIGGKGAGKRSDFEAWLAANLLTLVMAGDGKDPAPKAKDDPKGAPDGWTVRSGDREKLKEIMVKVIEAKNLVIDLKREEAIAKGQDPDKVGEKIKLEEIKKEWDQGKFGPKSAAALKIVAEFLQDGTVTYLRALDGYGIDIPPGCPIEPPLDESGRHIGDELFRAKLAKPDFKWDILKQPIEEGKLIDTDAVVRMAQAQEFIVEAQERIQSATLRADAGRLLVEIHNFEDPKKPETRMTGWYPKKELMERDFNETPAVRRQKDLELKKWIAATTTALAPFQKVRNYAQTVGFLHYISNPDLRTNSAFEKALASLPTVQRVIARWKGLDDGDRVFPDFAIRPENFPGKIVRNEKTKLVEMALPNMPPNPERNKEYRAAVDKANAWLDKIGPDVDAVQQQFALLLASGQVYEDGPNKGKPIISKDSLLMVSEEDYPDKFELDPDGKPILDKPITYPRWQKDSSGKPIGGQKVPDFNFCRHGMDVKKEGDEYVITPYKQYFWARDYAYNHWNVLGDWKIPFTDFNVGAMQKAGEKIYTRDPDKPLRLKAGQFALCIESGRLEFVPAEKVELWAKAAENGEDVSKYVALTIDLAMLATSAYEARGAQLLFRKSGELGLEKAVQDGARRAAWGQVGKSGWHFALASTGFGKQLLENRLGAGKTWDTIRGCLIIGDMSYHAFMPQKITGPVGKLIYGTEGLKLVQTAEMEAMFAKSGKFLDTLLTGSEKVLSGRGLAEMLGITDIAEAPWLIRAPYTFRHGVMPYADLYFIWDLNSKTFQEVRNKAKGADPLHINDAREALILGGPQANYDHKSPFEYTITPNQIKDSSERVMTEYGRSLTAWGFDHDKISFKLEKEIKEAKNQEKDKKKACIDHCLEAFVDPKSRAHKHAAAAGLLELCPAEGEASKQVLGEIKGKKITRQDVIDYLENSAEGLNKKTAEILEAKLPENDEKRSKHKQKLVEIFLSDADLLEKRAAAEGLFKLCAKDGKLEGVLGEVEITTGLGKKRKVALTGVEVTQYLNTTPDGLMREGRETLFSPDNDARKKRHIADAVYAFKNVDDEATKTAAAIALLGNGKEVRLDEVLGEATTYSVRLSFKKKEKKNEKDTDEYSQVKVVKFRDKEAADKFEKELREKYKDDKDALISTGTSWNRVTAGDALKVLREKALSADTSRMRLVAGDYLCRLSHLAENDFDIFAGQFLEAKKKYDKKPDDADLKKDFEAKKKKVDEAMKYGNLARFDYTDMVGACFEVLATEHAPRELKGEAIDGPAGPRLDFLLEYFRFNVEPRSNSPYNNKSIEELAGLYKRDSAAIEEVLLKLAKDKDADPDVRALAVSVLSANTAVRPTVNGQPISIDGTVAIGSKRSHRVYIEAKGQGVAEEHATITLGRNAKFSVAAINEKNEVWIKRPGEMKDDKPTYTYIKVGEAKTELKPGDQVILGDKEKGAVLSFGTERAALLARIHKEWSENVDKKGSYAELMRKRFKAELTVDTSDKTGATGAGGNYDLNVTKFRAALALDQLQDLSGFETDGDRIIAVNKALMECFDSTRPRLTMAVLEKLIEPVEINGKKQIWLDTLTDKQLASLRQQCINCLTLSGAEVTPQTDNDRKEWIREKINLKIALAEKLPAIFKGADVGQVAQVVHKLQSYLSKDLNDINNPYPLRWSSLREAAIEPLAKLSPETARLVLPDVVRKDEVETVRLRALEQLVETGYAKMRELCIERLTTETDPLILKRLWRMEWFERRPDRASAEYQREFETARKEIMDSSKRNLDGYEWLYCKSKGIDNLSAWKKGNALLDNTIATYRRKFQKEPTDEQIIGWLKSKEFKDFSKDYPYHEGYVKACVYTVISGGEGGKWMELGNATGADRARIVIQLDQTNNGDHYVHKANRSRNAILSLREICTELVLMEDPHAKDMVWAAESCLLKGEVEPNIRVHAAEALTILRKGGIISNEDFAITIAAALEHELKKIPDKEKNKELFKEHEKLLDRLVSDLFAIKTPKALPLLEAIVKDKDFPYPDVQKKADALLFHMRERIGYFTEIYHADKKKELADLAKPLKKVLTNPKTDVDTVCMNICLALNGRPIADKDDPRRILLLIAGGDASPRIRELAGEFLMESKVKEDRQRGAEIIASIYVRKPTKGTGLDADEFVQHLKKFPKLYPEGAVELIDAAIAAAKKEEANKPAPVAKEEKPERANYDRSLDYQAQFEAALAEIMRSWNAKIPRFVQEFELSKKPYKLLDPETLRKDYSKAVIDRWGDSAAKRFEAMFKKQETIKGDEAEAGNAVITNMWAEYKALRDAALTPKGEFERTFVKFVLRRGASSFWREHQPDAMKFASETAYQICQLKVAGAGEFEPLLASLLVDDLTLGPEVRGNLLNAYLELVEPKGRVSRKTAAITLAAILRTEYQNTPKPDQPGYKESEKRQLLILDKLQEWKTHMVSPVLEAIAKDHPIPSVKKKAGEILKEFATKDVEDILKFGRSLGSATLLPDDERLKSLVEAMNNDKRPIEERFRAASVIMTNGADDVQAKNKTRALLVACEAAEKSEKMPVRFDAAQLLLSVPADDMKYTRSIAARALAHVAIEGTPGQALESQAILKKMNDDERRIAVSELRSMIEKSKDKGQQANAAILMLQLCNTETMLLGDFYQREALTTLIDVALTGDDDLRGRLKGVLNDLTPKQCVAASKCALKWAEDHKDGKKAVIAEALALSAGFFSRADKETKSPAIMFDVAEAAEKLLGKDDDTRTQLVALVSGINKETLLKPIAAGADGLEIISIWRASRSDNEETRLGAALTLVHKDSKGVNDTYRFSAIDTLGELAKKGKSAQVRSKAETRLKELIADLEGPMMVGDRRKHWLYVDNPVLKLAAAQTILFDTGSQVTAEDRERAIIALASVAIEGSEPPRKEAEKLLFKLKDGELDKAVNWLGTMAFIAGRKETPDKAQILSCWQLAERLYEKAGVDPNSEKFLSVTLERKRAEGKADARELEVLSDRIADKRTERSKDPTAMYEEDRLDRYFKEYEAARKKYGEGSLEVARAQLALAKVAYCRSSNSENPTVRRNTGRMAEYHAKAAVEVFKKKLPADSLELCDALYRLGIAELKQSSIKPDWSEERDPKKQLTDAQVHLKEALSIYKKQKEKMPAIDGVWIASHLAHAYLQGGKYEEAAEVNKDLVEFSKGKFGVLEANDVLRAVTGLAAAYPTEFEEEKITARAKEAEPLWRQALALSTASNGEKDDETMRLMALLAKNLGEQKKDKEAVPYFETVIKHYKAQPKADKQKLAEIVADYGNSLFHLDKKKEAEAAFEDARKLRVAHEGDLIHLRQDWFKRLLGDGEPTLLSKDNLEKVFKDKEAAFERLEAAEKKYGKDSVEAAKERLTIAELFLKASQNTDHPTIFGNCARGALYNGGIGLEALAAKLGKDHPDLAMRNYQVAMAEMWAGKDEDAVGHLKQALAIATKNPEKVPSGDAIWIASRLVLANIRVGDQAEMEKALATLTELAGKKPGKSDRGDVSRALDQVVVAISNPLNTNKKPKMKEAEQLVKLAIEISNKHNGADSVQTAVLSVKQATTLAKRRDFESAEPLLKKAIAVLGKKEDFPKEEFADILDIYAFCLEGLKRPDEAKVIIARSEALRKNRTLVVKP